MHCRDILSIIFEHALGENILRVCRAWTEIIYKNIYSGEYSDVIKSRECPRTLPAICFPWLTMKQTVQLSYEDLKPEFMITWTDIMSHCRGRRDVNWLLKLQCAEHANTIENLYEFLYKHYEPFRRHMAGLEFVNCALWRFMIKICCHHAGLSSATTWFFTGTHVDRYALSGNDYSDLSENLNMILYNNTVFDRQVPAYHYCDIAIQPDVWYQMDRTGHNVIALPYPRAALRLAW